MSVDTLTDLQRLPDSKMKNNISGNGSFCSQHIQHNNEILEEEHGKSDAPVTETSGSGTGSECTVAEDATIEVEYIESEKLNDVEDVDTSVKTLLGGLESKEWVVVCEALNNVRRLSLFHKDLLHDLLENVLSLVVKSLKNPRSAVCKTAIMTSADIFKEYNDHIVEYIDPLLGQLLLKSSQDKRFVCEAAERTLITMTTWISSVLLLPKLQSYLKHRNPRIRAKASVCVCHSVLRLGANEITIYGIDKLTNLAASQLSDQLPESREAARRLLLRLHSAYMESHLLSAATISEDNEVKTWEHFCHLNLAPLSAQAVLRVTNVPNESRVLES